MYIYGTYSILMDLSKIPNVPTAKRTRGGLRLGVSCWSTEGWLVGAELLVWFEGKLIGNRWVLRCLQVFLDVIFSWKLFEETKLPVVLWNWFWKNNMIWSTLGFNDHRPVGSARAVSTVSLAQRVCRTVPAVQRVSAEDSSSADRNLSAEIGSF